MLQNFKPTTSLPGTSWLAKYIQTLTWNRFTASAAKRVSMASAEYVLIRLFVPSALASSLTYLATSTTGTVSKNMVHYYWNKKGSEDQTSILIPVPKEDVEILKAELEQNKQNWKWSLSAVPQKIAKNVKKAAVNTCFGVLDMTYQDMSEGLGGTVGSTVASAAFIFYMGPPSLFILPLYFLAEGFSKSIGAFIGKMWGRWYLGPRVMKPAIQSTWAQFNQPSAQELQEQCESIMIELEELNLNNEMDWEDDETPEQDILNSWMLMKAPEPKVSMQVEGIQMIQDYEPECPPGSELPKVSISQ